MLKAGITLYYIRHGETDWNRGQRYQGQRDIPLNATGRAQAKGNGQLLAAALGDRAAQFDYVASPLQRASETMQILRAEMGLDSRTYRTDDRLMEINYVTPNWRRDQLAFPDSAYQPIAPLTPSAKSMQNRL